LFEVLTLVAAVAVAEAAPTRSALLGTDIAEEAEALLLAKDGFQRTSSSGVWP
jgi:hypothetical protein